MGRGCGSWVCVNVVGKKKKKRFSKKNKKAESCKIHEKKISAYMPVLSPSPRSAKQILSESLVLVQTDTKIRNSVHYVNI